MTDTEWKEFREDVVELLDDWDRKRDKKGLGMRIRISLKLIIAEFFEIEGCNKKEFVFSREDLEEDGMEFFKKVQKFIKKPTLAMSTN